MSSSSDTQRAWLNLKSLKSYSPFFTLQNYNLEVR